MRSVVYGALITAFLASAGTVHAANELDGKALICEEEGGPERYIVFESGTFGGRAVEYGVSGYEIVDLSRARDEYRLIGTTTVYWNWLGGLHRLDRETLRLELPSYYDVVAKKNVSNRVAQCRVSSISEIITKLSIIIIKAQHKNKL